MDLDHPPADDDPALDELLLKGTAAMKGITLDEARAELAELDVESTAHARRRARMTPAQRCADDDLTDERVAAAIAASRERLRAERERIRAEVAAAAEPVGPDPATPGERRAGRGEHVGARPLRLVGGVFDDDDDDPRVIRYAR